MTSDDGEQKRPPPAVVVIGAGPAGLTAAYELAKTGHRCTILEADDIVGGISRTVERDGWRFDIGGHRFFTKVKPVDDLWFEILGADEFLSRPRMSRIFYKGKLYDYPLVPMNALRNLGPVEAVRCVLSYLWVRVRPPRNQHTLEGFIVSRFGWRLYHHFFETYNEKVWGVPPSEISADWGAQRIKNLSLMRAATEALTPRWVKSRRGREKQVTSLIEEFNYPKYGPGQMWERAAEIVTGQGSELLMESPVVGVNHSEGRATSVTARVEGEERTFACTDVISSMPFGLLIEAMDPPAPDDVLRAAARPDPPRLHHGRSGRARRVLVPRQLDLHPRSGRRGGTDPELRVVVALPGEGRPHVSRPRVLRQRG